jgi:hypothetical protein
LDGKNSHAPRNFYQAVAVQAGHFKIELIPGEFRVASYQGLKVTFRGASEKFEDSISDGFLLRHQAFLLLITNLLHKMTLLTRFYRNFQRKTVTHHEC